MKPKCKKHGFMFFPPSKGTLDFPSHPLDNARKPIVLSSTSGYYLLTPYCHLKNIQNVVKSPILQLTKLLSNSIDGCK